MKKVTLLTLTSEQERTVPLLRDLGVLHVTLSATPEAASSATHATMGNLQKALNVLGAITNRPSSLVTRHSPPAEGGECNAEGIAEKILAAQARISELGATLLRLRQEREEQEPLGDFNVGQIQSLIAQGIGVTLFRVPQKHAFPKGEGIVRLGTRRKCVYGAALGVALDCPFAETLPLPRRSLGDLDGDIQKNIDETAALTAELSDLTQVSDRLSHRVQELDTLHTFQRVAESVAAHGEIGVLEGYCPAPKVAALEAAAASHGWALWVRDPGPEDAVPVHLTLPRWIQPIAVLFKGLGILPGYLEADVSAVFLVFFSVFFAMLIGDAGYGLLLLAGVATVAFRQRRRPAKPVVTQALWLFGVLAACTVLWGMLTGNYFGIAAETLPPFMRGIPWLHVDSNLMWLCFVIGAVHLTIAHLWNAAVLFPARKAYEQIGWIGMVWVMFFTAGELVAGRAMPTITPWVGVASALLIVLFMIAPKDIKKEWINYPLLALNLVSCLIDIISYIRLFAVGMASAQIALTFNQMAVTGLPPWYAIVVTPLILLVGHGLNILLAALAILVHAVRLNTLEFSNHKGLTWSGQPYAPFQKHTKETP
ncbi:MAG: hypothetical protein FWF84_04365 [Kiritimatiellaeota bacterium]|nr:hypothetical protein [Kiritimatiellota bacterium]